MKVLPSRFINFKPARARPRYVELLSAKWFRRGFATHRINSQITDAFEVIAPHADEPLSHLLITAEHASMRLPEPYSWPKDDQRLIGTHWSYDIGSEDFARELAAATNSYCLLSRFSRLLCDPNRPLSSPTLFRQEAEGKPVALNQASNGVSMLFLFLLI